MSKKYPGSEPPMEIGPYEPDSEISVPVPDLEAEVARLQARVKELEDAEKDYEADDVAMVTAFDDMEAERDRLQERCVEARREVTRLSNYETAYNNLQSVVNSQYRNIDALTNELAEARLELKKLRELAYNYLDFTPNCGDDNKCYTCGEQWCPNECEVTCLHAMLFKATREGKDASIVWLELCDERDKAVATLKAVEEVM